MDETKQSDTIKQKCEELIDEIKTEDAECRAQLLKANINVTRIDYDHGLIYYDFAYRPYSGAPQRWGKTFVQVSVIRKIVNYTPKNWVNIVKDDALRMRKILEA
jgi:hypothetical protein